MTLVEVRFMPSDFRLRLYLVDLTIGCFILRQYSPKQLNMWFIYWLSKQPHTHVAITRPNFFLIPAVMPDDVIHKTLVIIMMYLMRA